MEGFLVLWNSLPHEMSLAPSLLVVQQKEDQKAFGFPSSLLASPDPKQMEENVPFICGNVETLQMP